MVPCNLPYSKAPPSPHLKQPFHLVQHVVDEAAGPRLWPGEAEEPAGAGHFAADGQALAEDEGAAGAAGGEAGGAARRAGFGEEGGDGLPLRVERAAAEGEEGLGQRLLEPQAQGCGQGVDAGGGEAVGGGEEAVEGGEDLDRGAEARAGLAGGVREEGEDRGVGRGEEALFGGGEEEGGLLPRRDGFADFVLGHHGLHGGGEVGGGADHGGDGGEGGVLRGEALVGGEAAQARDEAVAAGA